MREMWNLPIDETAPAQVRTCQQGHRIAFENMTVDGRCRTCQKAYYKRRREGGWTPKPKRGEPRTGGKKNRKGMIGPNEMYYLDPAPLVAWVEAEAQRRDLLVTEFVDQVGLNRRSWRRFKNGYEDGAKVRVSLDIVDKILIQTNTHLWDVYPDLYECGVAFETLSEAA